MLVEDVLRTFLLASLLSVGLAGTAFADASVAGDWRADLGEGVAINMNVTPDGHWSSETLQNNKVVRQMRGDYRQTRQGNDNGTLVFRPTQSSKGEAQVETDQYQLSENGSTMRLTAGGDTMVFERHQH
jgi:hypothetical protein